MTLKEFKKRLENLGFRVTQVIRRKGGPHWIEFENLSTGEEWGFPTPSDKELLASFYLRLLQILISRPDLPPGFFEALLKFLEKRRKNDRR